jgi:hypothetical protein
VAEKLARIPGDRAALDIPDEPEVVPCERLSTTGKFYAAR